MSTSEQDNNVGILAMEVYFPSTFVSQVDLEQANGVSAGKYTIGLGQDTMAFTGDHEDINSIALSVVKALLEKYSISTMDVGRIEIGTESLIDKSKSTKTVVMSLFEGNTDIEGATVVNACYGGTAALLNALAWVDSSAWDGRYAIVIAADIAVYADGPARPTGGCGSVAMLVGRDAPMKIDLKTRTCFATHVWDFFKPNMDSEYPAVNGALSQTCYLQALDDCYERFVEKSKKLRGRDVTVNQTDYFLFHSPYNKLVQKSFGRLLYHDMLNGVIDGSPVAKWQLVPRDKTYEDKELETALKSISAPGYKAKVSTGCEISKLIGNTYTASVYMNTAHLVSTLGSALVGKSVTLFSYGSGALASMFSIIPRETANEFSLQRMQAQLNTATRLASREKLTPADLTQALNARELSHGVAPFTPKCTADKLFPGAYYLHEINAQNERIYRRKPLSEERVLGGSLIPPPAPVMQRSVSFEEVGVNLDEDSEEDSRTATGALAAGMRAVTLQDGDASTSRPLGMSLRSNLTRNQTYVWASGRPNVQVVVTGVAAALPAQNDSEDGDVSAQCIQRVIAGESFLSQIDDSVKQAMLDKHVSDSVRNPDGSMAKRLITQYDQCIGVRGRIGNKFSLTSYGVSESIVATMDRAVQVAIAAGLEALKDAGIVTGEGPGTSGYVLPASMQNTTGIVYATSFPALDTAVEEVTKYFQTQTAASCGAATLMDTLRRRLQTQAGTTELSADTETALKTLQQQLEEASQVANAPEAKYEFDRKFLFRVLVLGNAQLAQIIKARGPNMQTNAACAGATQAIALAYDMIQVGRAERVIVIAGDNAASDNLMPWLGNGFRSLGAATTSSSIALAARPFHPERSGMILGSGGIGMVLESEEGARRRYAKSATPSARGPFRCRLMATLVSNSAYHGASMDREHIATEMERFISQIEEQFHISRTEIAQQGVYFSHETSTHASPTSSCAANEVYALRKVFGESLKDLLILNTKGFTGHPMGVSFEDVVAAEVLVSRQVPPIANLSVADPALGPGLKLSAGGSYPCKYAIRFAAGFGSQVALALYGAADVVV